MSCRRQLPIVHLRSTTTADLDFVVEAEGDPDTYPFIIPWSRAEHSAALGQPDIAHLLVEDDGEISVGFVILANLQNADENIEFRRVVVVQKGRGYGRAVIRAVKSLAFEELKADRLWLDVMEHNTRARSLYRSEGFIEEGVVPEVSCGPGRVESLVFMSLLPRANHS